MLEWGVRDLARMSQVGEDAVTRFEAGEVMKPRTVQAMRSALEEAGVIFVESGDGVGVRLKRPLD